MKRQSKIAGAVTVLAAAVMLASGNVSAEDKAPPVPVPKTGATKSYAKGDDGEYQAGVAWPKERFTVDKAGETVTDNLTGLMWPKNLNHAHKDMVWADAVAFCRQLDLGGHKDWRLANVRELQSLSDWNEQIAMVPKDHPFTGVPAMMAWSSTTCAKDTNSYWYVRTDGYVGHQRKEDTQWPGVIPVRGGVAKDGNVIAKGILPVAKTGQTQSYAPGDDGDLQMGVPWPNPRFTLDKSGECVTDNLTGLTWAKDGNYLRTMNWYEAIDYCENLELGAFKDWRLPNVKELQALPDYSVGMPGEPFVNTLRVDGASGYWSSTIFAKFMHPGVVLGQGYVSKGGMVCKEPVWPVRGGTLNPVKKPAEPAKEPEKK